MANILGIDYGQKYIGYAVGNDILTVPLPKEQLFTQIKKTSFKKYKI